ncbi:hypothetical protein AB0O72_13115 [Streptomyces sp. NPDC088106]
MGSTTHDEGPHTAGHHGEVTLTRRAFLDRDAFPCGFTESGLASYRQGDR